MEAVGFLAQGFQVALQPANIIWLFVGIALGLIIGVLPGLGGTSGVAILLPVTVRIVSGDPTGGPTTAVILLAGVYWGALFGGVVTSILFNIPGEPWTVALLFDGYPLAKHKGKPGLALSSSFLASFVGALISTVLFTFFAIWLSDAALKFGPPEYFATYLLAFATLTGLESGSPLKSVAMIGFGLLLAAVGFDSITGTPRLWFGYTTMQKGIDFVPVTIGLFGLGELLASVEESGEFSFAGVVAKVGLTDVVNAARELLKRKWLILWSTLVGFWIGVLPGTGATPASMLGYGMARSFAKNKEDFGKGEISGIIAPQAAADSAGVGSLLPMITLGVPGSPTAAVIMAGLFIWGLQPGPLLFQTNTSFVWGLIASIYLGQVIAFLICIFGVPILASIMRIPYAILTPFIVVISVLGSYTINNDMRDVVVAVVFGIVGFVLRKAKFPLAPLVVAIVLGDATERVLRQSLIMSDGSMGIFFTRPIAAVMSIAAIALFLVPAYQFVRRQMQPPGSAPKPPAQEEAPATGG